VFFRKLQANIVIILVIILVTGMILIDFVMMTSVKGILIRSEASKARLFLRAVENNLTLPSGENSQILDIVMQDRFKRMFDESKVDCALALDPRRNLIYAIGRCMAYEEELKVAIQQTMDRDEPLSRFFGESGGIFFRQREGVIVALPLRKSGRTIAGAGAVLRFDDVYATLKQTHYILILYIVVNTVFLTIFGFYRLSRVTVKPVHKLLEQAEDYWEFDEEMFLYAQDKDGFRKLATTFNRMLKRISADKKELEATVSHLETANRELKKAQEEVIRAEKLASVGRLSAGIAHEIGNPIAIVMGYLDLLKSDDIMADERKEFVQRTEKEIDRIHGIIRQLLNFSRSSDGDVRRISAHAVIRDVVDVVRYQPMMADIRFSLNLDARQDAVKADIGKLRQVFLNLIINAGDAILSNPNGESRITIGSAVVAATVEGGTHRASHQAAWIRLTFQDTGPGISETDLSNIFDPFYTTKEPGKGTGLGLSTSIAIVEQMGGRITVDSEEGSGTTMIVQLPLNEGEDEGGPRGGGMGVDESGKIERPNRS